jgi:hypothetical protein
MTSLKSILLSTAMRYVYYLAVLALPIAMTMPWSNAPGVGFALGLALGLAGAGLVVSLTAARRSASAAAARIEP